MLCSIFGIAGNLIIGIIGMSDRKSIPMALFGFFICGGGAPAVLAVVYSAMLTIKGYSSVDTMSFLVLSSNLGAALSGVLIGLIGKDHDGNLSTAWFVLAGICMINLLLGELWVPLGGRNVLGEADSGETAQLLPK